ncbi:helix-turn-helix transcriptional regulator [Clostridium beijerinckii]|uniref:helix-turn-helix transcriptional regulator n=1 Tax=Clostridium beijerinckii TaxID=1520 RepID=UPI001F439420|nr:helix-turn-helix transcriptional regulator [Clostridium beijerinckii]
MTKLKKLRIELGFSQTGMAKRLHLSTRHYQRFENEADVFILSDKRRQEIAKIFSCNVAEISQMEER